MERIIQTVSDVFLILGVVVIALFLIINAGNAIDVEANMQDQIVNHYVRG